MKFLNYTPHSIHMPDGSILAPENVPIRCGEETRAIGKIANNPIIIRRYSEIEGLPPVQTGVWLIVSSMVRMACANRSDLLSPGDLIRDARGNVTGCTNLIANDAILLWKGWSYENTDSTLYQSL
jgi:hypothetical protein